MIFTKIIVNKKNPFAESIHIAPQNDILIDINAESDCVNPFRITLSIFKDGIRLFSLHDTKECSFYKGTFKSNFTIPPYLLRQGIYTFALGAYTNKEEWLWNDNVFIFEIMSVFDTENDKRDFGLFNINAITKAERISL